ncbi:MAG: hypothetical protein BME93_00665 [Methanosarcinales archaeon Met12]|nr:MAG: hypothetical protein BME93_00665 [Methanosarcinales archaeon Met12]
MGIRLDTGFVSLETTFLETMLRELLPSKKGNPSSGKGKKEVTGTAFVA